MVEGESGLLAISPPWFRPHYEPSKRRLTWPNGAIATTYSADEPDRLRGPQHDLGWCDELATWRYPDAWDQFLFGLRLGKNPQCVVTSTPKRVKLIRELFKDPTCVITGGSTYDNIQNLARPFIERIVKRYEGTTLGRQELHAHLLEDVEGAMWKREQIETFRIPKAPDLVRIVVAIDPAVTSSEDSDETGIVVAGIGADGHGYVLADESLRATPLGWASRAVTSYLANKADRIIGEANNGGDLIEQTIRTVNDRVSYTKVTASRGKQTRAEPVAALYEQGRVHHVGQFAYLEDEMCSWVPGDASPNRMDALVWALTELMVKEQDRMVVYPGA
jgi:phage terminase large subunit-like protein